jgi:hypothetical protein
MVLWLLYSLFFVSYLSLLVFIMRLRILHNGIDYALCFSLFLRSAN